MQNKVVAILETRTGEHMLEMIARRGGVPLWAPALEEVPDIDPLELKALIKDWREQPYKVVIFQTGVGTRMLFQTTDELNLTDELVKLLSNAVVVVRGPKPVGELNSRGVKIDIRAQSPFTTETVAEGIIQIPVQGERVLVQRYGAANLGLREILIDRGARIVELATYRWALPQDLKPLQKLLAALANSSVDAVVFTSAVQLQNLFNVAESLHSDRLLADQLNQVVIASIGPICSKALMVRGIRPTFEASPPKLGPLLEGLERALTA